MAQNLGRKGDAVSRKTANGDRHRQIGQAERFGFRFRSCRGRLWQTVENDLACVKFVDRDIARQERRAIPVQHHISQGKPDALIVSDGQFGQAGLRRKCALKPGDDHLPPSARQVVLKKGGQIIAVALLSKTRQRG